MGPSVLPSSTRIRFRLSLQLLRATGPLARRDEEGRCWRRHRRPEEIIERVAALDIGKAELVCCVRVPGAAGQGRRVQEVTTYTTMTRSLLAHGRPARASWG